MINNIDKQKYTQVVIALLISMGLFAAGFYIGKERVSGMAPVQVLNATSTESVDMAPFWKSWRILDEKFSAASSTTPPVSSQDKMWGAIEGLAASFGDPYTVFFPPADAKIFEEEIAGSFGGVGMEIGVQDDLLTVIAPIKGTPAYNAGVLAGDKVVSIDDRLALKMNSDEAIKLIRGEVGTPVTITFARKEVNEPIVKTLVRAVIDIPTIDTKLNKDGVFVIELYSFSATSPNLFRGALRKFVESGSDKLVVDLRNNPGGYLEASIDMASWFLPAGKVVVTEKFGDGRPDEFYKSKGYDIFNDKLKMVILVNGGSASASEILAGALSEYDKATLVGQQTFGKGSVQELVNITDDTSLKVTVAHWFTPDGTFISKEGLTPDIKVELTKENTADGKDPTLDAAVKYLLEK